MKKNSLLVVIDKIVWWFIALFPLIILLFSVINHNIVSIGDILANLGFTITNDNIIFNALNDIFGANGNYLKLFDSVDFIHYATYFVTINLVHLVIDLLLVLVDWCHNALKGVFRKW